MKLTFINSRQQSSSCCRASCIPCKFFMQKSQYTWHNLHCFQQFIITQGNIVRSLVLVAQPNQACNQEQSFRLVRIFLGQAHNQKQSCKSVSQAHGHAHLYYKMNYCSFIIYLRSSYRRLVILHVLSCCLLDSNLRDHNISRMQTKVKKPFSYRNINNNSGSSSKPAMLPLQSSPTFLVVSTLLSEKKKQATRKRQHPM